MSRKRRNTSSPEYEGPVRNSTLRQLQDDHYESGDDSDEYDTEKQPQINASTGQAGAFPELKDSSELFYGPANNGIDYLRMVRSEAQGIPQLLKAHQSEDERSLDGAGSWDGDGTYVAKPLFDHASTTTASISGAQGRYSQSLMTQFQSIRAAMQTVPPLSAVEKLKSSQPISFPRDNKKSRHTWETALKGRDPSPTQVACMDQNSLFQLIRLLQSNLRSLFEGGENQINRVGAWVWSILAKCPDRGQLDPEETSILRKFAQQAIDLVTTLDSSTTLSVMDGVQDENNSVTSVDTAAVQTRYMQPSSSLAKLQETQVVILDMIILVVGEVYGQRDLLEQRKVWQC